MLTLAPNNVADGNVSFAWKHNQSIGQIKLLTGLDEKPSSPKPNYTTTYPIVVKIFYSKMSQKSSLSPL